jgi:type IV pilus assembly protein PilV
VLKNNKGFTLIEVLIALFILVVGMLALLNAVAVSIEHNLINVLRDEAVKIAEQKMNEEKASALAVKAWTCGEVQRSIRNVATMGFNVCSRVANPAANTWLIEVAVGWNYKGTGTTAPTTRKYQHSISSVVYTGT